METETLLEAEELTQADYIQSLRQFHDREAEWSDVLQIAESLDRSEPEARFDYERIRRVLQAEKMAALAREAVERLEAQRKRSFSEFHTLRLQACRATLNAQKSAGEASKLIAELCPDLLLQTEETRSRLAGIKAQVEHFGEMMESAVGSGLGAIERLRQQVEEGQQALDEPEELSYTERLRNFDLLNSSGHPKAHSGGPEGLEHELEQLESRKELDDRLKLVKLMESVQSWEFASRRLSELESEREELETRLGDLREQSRNWENVRLF